MVQISQFNNTIGNIGDYYIQPGSGVRFTIVDKTSDNQNVWENDKSGGNNLEDKVDENCTDIASLQQNFSTLQSLFQSLVGQPDSRSICRSNTVQNQPPTNGLIDPEFPSPVDGDTAIVLLANGIVEFWSFDSNWTRDKTQTFGGGSSFDPTSLQQQIDAINQLISNQSGQSAASFFCRVGAPNPNNPPTPQETGLTSAPSFGYQFMIILPDDTIQVWQYTQNQWELKQTIDFASITNLVMLRPHTCRTNNVAGVAPSFVETGATPYPNFFFNVYLANGTQEIWLYNGTGWILKQTIPVSVSSGVTDVGQGEVSKNPNTGVISITGTTTAGTTNTVQIRPSDIALIRNSIACVDELHFCGFPTGITFPVRKEDAYVSEDIATIDMNCVDDCSLVYDCAGSGFYRKINNGLAPITGSVDVAKFYGSMSARNFACKFEASGQTYCNNYVETYEHKDYCMKICIGDCRNIQWPAITTGDASSFTIQWDEDDASSLATYADGAEPSHNYTSAYTGSIVICFQKCAKPTFTAASAVTDASFLESNCGC